MKLNMLRISRGPWRTPDRLVTPPAFRSAMFPFLGRLSLLFILSAVEILKILRPAPNHAKLYTRTVEGCIPVKRIPLWERSR